MTNQQSTASTTITQSLKQSQEELFFAHAQDSVPFQFGGASHVGLVREHNEDHFAVFKRYRSTEVLLANLAAGELNVADAFSYAMVVADGMGGMKSGEVASRLALHTMAELAGQATSWVMKLTDLDAQQISMRVQAYVQQIQATILERSEADYSLDRMGTTWTSAHLMGHDVVVVHLGDSRAYFWREGRMHRITRDETLAQSLIDAGSDPESVAKFRHVVLNCFGGGNKDAKAVIHHLRLEPGDQLLLCTDGLSDMVEDGEIAEELQRHASPQDACDALIQRALDEGGKDNVTVVVASPDRQAAE